MSDLDNLLKLLTLTLTFRDVERGTIMNGRHENDAEHCFQLALACWYVIETKKLPYDMTKVFKYALCHDLVEAYAGDVWAHGRTPEITKQKKEHEHEALLRIEKEFPEASDMLAMMHAYEKREDSEAKFVYALDKVLPMANIYLDGGNAWRIQKVTLDMLRDIKDTTTAVSPDVYPYWEELRGILEKNEKTLFHSPIDSLSDEA